MREHLHSGRQRGRYGCVDACDQTGQQPRPSPTILTQRVHGAIKGPPRGRRDTGEGVRVGQIWNGKPYARSEIKLTEEGRSQGHGVHS